MHRGGLKSLYQSGPIQPVNSEESQWAPAVRALILYPMNALVEDQISRLRAALDSDGARSALDKHLAGNRIRFGRYNGLTQFQAIP